MSQSKLDKQQLIDTLVKKTARLNDINSDIAQMSIMDKIRGRLKALENEKDTIQNEIAKLKEGLQQINKQSVNSQAGDSRSQPVSQNSYSAAAQKMGRPTPAPTQYGKASDLINQGFDSRQLETLDSIPDLLSSKPKAPSRTNSVQNDLEDLDLGDLEKLDDDFDEEISQTPKAHPPASGQRSPERPVSASSTAVTGQANPPQKPTRPIGAPPLPSRDVVRTRAPQPPPSAVMGNLSDVKDPKASAVATERPARPVARPVMGKLPDMDPKSRALPPVNAPQTQKTPDKPPKANKQPLEVIDARGQLTGWRAKDKIEKEALAAHQPPSPKK